MRNPFEVCHKCGQVVDQSRSFAMTGKGIEHETCPVSDIDQAKTALDQAREAHAAAMVARHHAPADPLVQQQLRDAVRQGRSAWRAYQAAATSGLAAQIEAIVPSDFQD